MTVGMKLRIERVKMGKSQVEVARLVSSMGTPLTQIRLSAIERGVLSRHDEARALASIFNLPVEELLGAEAGR